MPKILHCIPYMDEVAGGPPVVVSQTIKNAPFRKWKHAIVTSGSIEPRGVRSLVPPQTEESLYFSNSVTSLLFRSSRIADILSGVDLLHVHTSWSPLAFACCKVAINNRIPTIYSPHGMLDPWSLSQSRLKKRVYWSLFEKKIVNSSARIIFTSKAEAASASRIIPQNIEASIIPLGAERPEAPLDLLKREFDEIYPELKNRRKILFFGRIHPKKQPDFLLDAFAHVEQGLPQSTLCFVGDLEPKYGKWLLSRATALGLASKIRFFGHLSGRSKHQILAACDVFVLPSLQENFGIAIIEAMMARLPVIISDNVDIAETIREQNAGTVISLSEGPKAYARNILSVLRDQEEASRMGGVGQQFALAEYTWQRSSQLMHEVYEETLRKSP